MEYDDVIAKSPYDFQTLEELSLQHGESSLGNLISDAYIYSVKNAEGDDYVPITAAIVPNGTIRGSIIQGEVTTADAFSICSLGIGKDKVPSYPLISVYLTGKELKTVCEVDASIAPLMSDAQLYFSGMSFTFNPNRLIFNKVINSGLISTDGKIEEFENSKLYRVVVNLYSAQMLSVVGDKSYGLLSIVPKTKDGSPITDYEAQIIYQNENGEQRELKEWYAVVKYFQSFGKENGVSVIPAYYNETHARKLVDDNTNFFAIISKPNHIALAVYLIISLLLALIITVIVRIVRRKKRRNKKSAK
jgi:2',3'-cyclic-nucleotide 2'-phosphodiesterase (5'-nucleotidase family)